MSGWSDYGFPDITGVPIQTALEGLAAAVNERCYALNKFDPLPSGGVNIGLIAPVQTAMSLVEYAFEHFMQWVGGFEEPIGGAVFVLPDWTPFSLAAAAEYLGEDLISLPYFSRVTGYDWSDPFPDIGYDWIMQRYRMMNAACMYTFPNDHATVIYGGGAVDWTGDTLAEAWNEVDKNFTERTETTGSGTFFAFARCDRWPSADSGPGYVCSRQIGVAQSLQFRGHTPGQLGARITATPWASYAEFDDFGTGITEGEKTVLFDTPPDVADRDYVMLPAAQTAALLAKLRVARSTRSAGFRLRYERFVDLNRSLEFLDPMEGA